MIKFDWEEKMSYLVSFSIWVIGCFPIDCVGWTHLLAFLITFITLVFITLPKAWDFQRKRYYKKKRKEKDIWRI